MSPANRFSCFPMEEQNSMKILDICTVFPSDSPSQFSLPLTFLDRIWLKREPTSRVFFYQLSEPNTDFINTILPKLKQSLSQTLKHYLPLTGNLTWPHDSDLPVIQYNSGDGVSLTIGESQADFDYLSGDSFRESAELYSLLPKFPSSETLIPSMTLQITLFPKRGFSIAYVAHHAIMDGKATSMFIHSWAYICKKGEISDLPPELTPCLDRTFVQDHAHLEKVFPKGFSPVDPQNKTLTTFDMTPPDIMLGTFRLTREEIEALKNEVKINERVSTFTITSAYIWICLIKTRKVTADETFIAFSVDCRFRLDPPLPSTYFGNCLIVSGGSHDTKDILAQDHGLVTAVNVVNEAVTILNQGIVKIAERASSSYSSPVPKNFAVFTIGGSPRFELYKVDFGWGKPIKVEMISLDSATFYLSDRKDGKVGIEIGIALKKHETEAFASIFTNGLGALQAR